MKRGMSHIEVILSFLLFIGFLVAGLYFFNPLNSTRVLDSTLAYAQDEIIANATTDVNVYGVSLNALAPPTGRLKIPPTDRIFSAARVETSTGTSLPAELDGEEVVFERQGDTFVYLILGSFPLQTSPSNSGEELTDEHYRITSTDLQTRVDEARLRALADHYRSEYTSVKNGFNLPGRTDFGFILRLADGEEIVAMQAHPEGIDILTEEKAVEFIREDGALVQAILYVSVW